MTEQLNQISEAQEDQPDEFDTYMDLSEDLHEAMKNGDLVTAEQLFRQLYELYYSMEERANAGDFDWSDYEWCCGMFKTDRYEFQEFQSHEKWKMEVGYEAIINEGNREHDKMTDQDIENAMKLSQALEARAAAARLRAERCTKDFYTIIRHNEERLASRLDELAAYERARCVPMAANATIERLDITAN